MKIETTLNLFEYQQNKEHPFKDQKAFEPLEEFLQDIWEHRKYQDDQNYDTDQKFISYTKKYLQSKNYVGTIHFEGYTINLLPKIFREADKNIEAINTHILWWLSYCDKIEFPRNITNIDSLKTESFFEILMYLFAQHTHKVLEDIIYQHYIEVEQETSFMKGTLNVPVYMRDNIVTGRWHLLNCRYEEFSIDNQFNRIIKYVIKLLYMQTHNADTKKYFDEILFIFDEVSDEVATAEQCERVQLGIMFDDLIVVLDYCKLFLQSCVSFKHKDELRLFTFLLPMEYVFEDFVYGFLKKEFKKECEEAEGQKSSCLATVDEEKMFFIRPDLKIEAKGKQYIADTKYKLIYPDKNKLKDCIASSDIYQMISYAVGLGINEVKLLYPSHYSKEQVVHTSEKQKEHKIKVKNRLCNNIPINIEIHKIDIINHELLTTTKDIQEKTIQEHFEDTKISLKDELLEIFEYIT